MLGHPWIDTHVHVSDIAPDGQVRANLLAELVDVLDRSGEDLRFLLSTDGARTARMIQHPDAIAAGNAFIHELCEGAPGRFYGSCTVNPHFLDASLASIDRCVGECGFVQLGEMLQYTMDYRMDSDAVETLTRRAVELEVPIQVHISTSNRTNHASSFGDEQLQDLFGLVHRVREAQYVLAHLVGMPDDSPPVVDGYLDAIDREFGSFPGCFWAEIRDFNSPGVKSVLERVPAERLLAGTDWTNRLGPPFLPYGVIFGVTDPEENPYQPRIEVMADLLRAQGASEDVIRKVGFENAAGLYGLAP